MIKSFSICLLMGSVNYLDFIKRVNTGYSALSYFLSLHIIRFMIQIKAFSTCLFIALLLVFSGSTAFAAAGTCTIAAHPFSSAQEIPGGAIVKKEKKIKAKWKPFAAARVFRPINLGDIIPFLGVGVMFIGLLLSVAAPAGLILFASRGILISLLITLGAFILGLLLFFLAGFAMRSH